MKQTTSKPGRSAAALPAGRGRRWVIGILLLSLVLGAALRLVKLDEYPPGWHMDEASNAWNTYCLLKIGQDENGAVWPIFYARAFGENRSTSYIYAALPFQAVGGMNLWTARLPAALGGVLTIFLMYFVGARLFGRTTGLIAAALLAVNPWHISVCRLGLEASLAPLMIVSSVAMLLWANLPFGDSENRPPRPVRAGLAGAVAGVACYGYWASRMLLPLLLPLAVLVTWRGWWRQLKSRKGALAIGAVLLAFAAVFGPLAWKHLTDPAMARRGQTEWVWEASDSLGAKAAKMTGRYIGHFGPGFLFIRGDRWILHDFTGEGVFNWYMLPLMLAGAGFVLWRIRSSRASRILLVWILLYPLPDVLLSHPTGAHFLRSLAGLPALVLLGAVGAAGVGQLLWAWRRKAALAGGVGLAIVALAFNVHFLHRYYGRIGSRPDFFSGYKGDFSMACRWLRPRVDEADMVFVTVSGGMQPYIHMLVGLEYDPRQWACDKREYYRPANSSTHRCARFGKFYFTYTDPNNAMRKIKPRRVIFIVRPGELKRLSLVHTIRSPTGEDVLFIHEIEIIYDDPSGE